MNKLLPVTDLKMTRFSITMNDAIDLVYNAIKKALVVKYLFQKYHHINYLIL